MDYQFNTTLHNSEKPSKLLALLALIVVFTLPFIMVKIFPHKNKTKLFEHLSILPETTPIPKTNSKITPKSITLPIVVKPHAVAPTWKIINIRSGDSLGVIFKRIGLSARTLQEIIDHSREARTLTKLTPGQNLRFLIKDNKLEQMIFPVSEIKYLVVSRHGLA